MGRDRIELDEETLALIRAHLSVGRYKINDLAQATVDAGFQNPRDRPQGARLYRLVGDETKRFEGDRYVAHGRIALPGVRRPDRKRLDAEETTLVGLLRRDGWKITEVRDRFEREGRAVGVDADSVYDAIYALYANLARSESRPGPVITAKPFCSPYRPADLHDLSDERLPFEVDPNEIDRGTNVHHETETRLAQIAAAYGKTPASADIAVEPDIDIAWWDGEDVVMVEIKSITDFNESKQIRLGIGQILDYQHDAEKTFRITVRPVLALSAKPIRDRWHDLCAHHAIRLVWPETFESLFRQ